MVKFVGVCICVGDGSEYPVCLLCVVVALVVAGFVEVRFMRCGVVSLWWRSLALEGF